MPGQRLLVLVPNPICIINIDNEKASVSSRSRGADDGKAEEEQERDLRVRKENPQGHRLALLESRKICATLLSVNRAGRRVYETSASNYNESYPCILKRVLSTLISRRARSGCQASKYMSATTSTS